MSKHGIEHQPELLHDENHLKLFMIGNYIYAERKGKDSVAFVIYDEARMYSDKRAFCLINEYKPPIRTWIVSAYGGSIDTNKSLAEIVQQEVKEEAGMVVSLDGIQHVGKYFVSTQMNQFCHLFFVHIGAPYLVNRCEREPDSLESVSTPVWLTYDEVMASECWKARLIVSEVMINSIFKGAYHGTKLNKSS